MSTAEGGIAGTTENASVTAESSRQRGDTSRGVHGGWYKNGEVNLRAGRREITDEGRKRGPTVLKVDNGDLQCGINPEGALRRPAK